MWLQRLRWKDWAFSVCTLRCFISEKPTLFGKANVWAWIFVSRTVVTSRRPRVWLAGGATVVFCDSKDFSKPVNATLLRTRMCRLNFVPSPQLLPLPKVPNLDGLPLPTLRRSDLELSGGSGTGNHWPGACSLSENCRAQVTEQFRSVSG
jgi:hypothetical protein